MKFAFVDYENLNSLDQLNLQQYDHIFLFMGANQQQIQFSERFDHPLPFTLIQVKYVSKNNLDFHIAYYLGKLDGETPPEVEFYVLSQDKGYQGICQFVESQKNARVCKLINIEYTTQAEMAFDTEEPHIKVTPSPTHKVSELYPKYLAYLLSKPKTKRPKKVISLINEITSYLSLQGNVKVVGELLSMLLENGIMQLNGVKMSYLE
ncbi:hypothetical protein A1D29_01775 [Pasteurellaceae bacterium Orientalotternb1]|nr:hypothetical protein A1D29_01775 [Pasteurellaceae bacterium Orientalotternb1]